LGFAEGHTFFNPAAGRHHHLVDAAGLRDRLGRKHFTGRRHLRLQHHSLEQVGGVDVLVLECLRHTVFDRLEEGVRVLETVCQRLHGVVLRHLRRGRAIRLGLPHGCEVVGGGLELQVAESAEGDQRDQ